MSALVDSVWNPKWPVCSMFTSSSSGSSTMRSSVEGGMDGERPLERVAPRRTWWSTRVHPARSASSAASARAAIPVGAGGVVTAGRLAGQAPDHRQGSVARDQVVPVAADRFLATELQIVPPAAHHARHQSRRDKVGDALVGPVPVRGVGPFRARSRRRSSRVHGWPASFSPRGSNGGWSGYRPATIWTRVNPLRTRSAVSHRKSSGHVRRVVSPIHHAYRPATGTACRRRARDTDARRNLHSGPWR